MRLRKWLAFVLVPTALMAALGGGIYKLASGAESRAPSAQRTRVETPAHRPIPALAAPSLRRTGNNVGRMELIGEFVPAPHRASAAHALRLQSVRGAAGSDKGSTETDAGLHDPNPELTRAETALLAAAREAIAVRLRAATGPSTARDPFKGDASRRRPRLADLTPFAPAGLGPIVRTEAKPTAHPEAERTKLEKVLAGRTAAESSSKEVAR